MDSKNEGYSKYLYKIKGINKSYIPIAMHLINLEIQTHTHAFNTEYSKAPTVDGNTDELP